MPPAASRSSFTTRWHGGSTIGRSEHNEDAVVFQAVFREADADTKVLFASDVNDVTLGHIVQRQEIMATRTGFGGTSSRFRITAATSH